jgi:hypothetical protein
MGAANFLVALTEGAESASFDSLKDLAKEDQGVLKQMTFVHRLYHGEDPRLTSKEAKVAMQGVLSKLLYKDDRSAYFMGGMNWEPNISVWMRFLDMVGEQSLGKYFGLGSQADIPGFSDDSGPSLDGSSGGDTDPPMSDDAGGGDLDDAFSSESPAESDGGNNVGDAEDLLATLG